MIILRILRQDLSVVFFFNSLHLLITFVVLHKSRFSRLASDLLHSLFQLNGFKTLSRIELRNVVSYGQSQKSKIKRSKETG